MQLAAKHYYIKYGTERSEEKTRSIVWECLSLNLIERKSEVKLVQLISTANEQVSFNQDTEFNSSAYVISTIYNAAIMIYIWASVIKRDLI